MALYEKKWNFIAVIFLIVVLPTTQSLKIYYEDGQLNIYGKAESPFEVFQEIDFSNFSTLERIMLHKVEFRPPDLLRMLKRCVHLREIKLDEVTWTGEFKDKLNLPQLTSVEILRKNWTFSGSTPQEFFDILFFANMENTTQMEQMKTSVDSDRGYFWYETKSLYVFWIPYDLQQYFSYTELEATRSVMDLSKFSGPGVTHVSITNSILLNGSSADLFSRLGNIRKLTLKSVTFENQDSAYNLSSLPTHSLEVLNLDGANLVPFSNETSNLKYPKLNSLLFTNVTFTRYGIQSPRNTENLWIPSTISVADGFRFISGMVSLREMVLIGVTVAAVASKFDMTWLSNSKETIRNLRLDNLQLTLSHAFQFTGIRTLTLKNCTLDQSLLWSLPSLFKNTDTVFLTNQINDSLLQALLQTSMNELTIEEDKLIPEEYVKHFLDELGAISETKHGITLFKQKEGWKILKEHETDAEFLAAMEEIDPLFYIYLSSLALICSIGILGNIVSVCVLLTKAMQSSTSCLMTALALFDLSILVTASASLPLYAFKLQELFLRTSVISLNDFASDRKLLLQQKLYKTAKLLGEAESSFIYPLSKTAYTGSVYLTILLTLERFAAVCYPLKVKFWTSKRKAIWSSALILLSAILVNIPRWFEAEGAKMVIKWVYLLGSKFKLTLNRVFSESEFNILQSDAYRTYYHGYVWTFLMYILPLPLLCFLNMKIWTQTRSSVVRRRQLSSSDTDGGLTSLTLILLCVSVSFVLCNATNGAIVWILVTLGHHPRDIDVFASIPIAVNSSTNFFFYCILGKKFRGELISGLRKCAGVWHWPTDSQAEAPAAPRPTSVPSCENENVRLYKTTAETEV